MTAPPASRARRAVAFCLSLLAAGAGHAILGRWLRGLVLAGIVDVLFLLLPWTGVAGLVVLIVVRYVGVPLDAALLRRTATVPTGAAVGLTILFWIGNVATSVVHRRLWLEAFKIPSGSMIPTLEVGDHILVKKGGGAVERGDLIVYEYPRDPDKDFIHRVIGLPGDRVAVRGGVVVINGKPAKYANERACTYFDLVDDHISWKRTSATCVEERIDGRAWTVMRTPGRSAAFPHGQVEDEYVVPDGAYFMLGDNRWNSHDSRYWGAVPARNIRGEALFVWWSAGPDGTRWDRIGNAVR